MSSWTRGKQRRPRRPASSPTRRRGTRAPRSPRSPRGAGTTAGGSSTAREERGDLIVHLRAGACYTAPRYPVHKSPRHTSELREPRIGAGRGHQYDGGKAFRIRERADGGLECADRPIRHVRECLGGGRQGGTGCRVEHCRGLGLQRKGALGGQVGDALEQLDQRFGALPEARYRRLQAIPADGLEPGRSGAAVGEVRQKLARHRPSTLGHASRLSGMTPAAVSLLLVHLKKGQRKPAADESPVAATTSDAAP